MAGQELDSVIEVMRLSLTETMNPKPKTFGSCVDRGCHGRSGAVGGILYVGGIWELLISRDFDVVRVGLQACNQA